MNRPVKQSDEPAASVPSASDETYAIPPTDAPEPLPLFAPPEVPGEVGRLGPYRIVKELGRGGMGAVYAALDTRLDRPLALKVMLPQFAANPSAKERFLREARAAAKISHDNVVTVYEADERDGVPYIAMQFLKGYPLDEFLKKKGTPSIGQILRIARETAAGLAAAHRIGLVHRDIKPANLWLEAPQGRVKVLDFGLAKPLDAEVELTKTGAVVGTPAYMSPEQGRGLKVDHRTDLFSLGSVLYRLCTGRIPFHGPTTMAVLMALGTEEPTPVREINPNVPEPLAALIHQLLAKNPDARPQSADEVVKRLRAMSEAPVPTAASAEAVSQPQVVYVPIQVTVLPQDNPFADLDATEAETIPTAESAEPAPPRKPRRDRLPMIAAGFATLLALVVGGIILIIKNKDGSETKIEVPDGSTVKIGTDKNGKTVVTITPEKGSAEVGTDDSADRKAAEYVLSIGGTVQVNGDQRNIITAADLPKARLVLTYVNLAKCAVSDAGLVNFKDCKGLTHLVLNDTAVTDAGLVNFKDCTVLKALSLNNTGVTDAGLAYFNNCKDLIYLYLSGARVTDDGMVHFLGCQRLGHLWLSDTQVTDAGLVHFKDCKALTSLHLLRTAVTDAGLAHFKDNKGLQELILNSTQVTDAGLPYFKDCKGLTKLWLRDTQVTDAGLAHFKNCKGLTNLHVAQTRVTPQGVADFHDAVPGCTIEHDGGTIPGIDPDRKAAEFVLAKGGVVHVDGLPIAITAAADLPKTRFTLTTVNLDGRKEMTDAELAIFKDLKDVTYLTFHNVPVTDAGLANFKNNKGLTFLNLCGTAVTDAGLAHFKDCKGLSFLNLSSTAVTDTGLANFKDCKGLKVLNLSNTAVSSAGLAHFSGCTGLGELYLNGTKATDAGLVHFKDCKELTNLNLNSTAVTDAGLAHLKGCQGLKLLDVKATKVTLKGAEQFHAAVPGCRIEHDDRTFEPKK